MDEILWHRRESRRQTENTNIVLHCGSLLPTRRSVYRATDTKLNRFVASDVRTRRRDLRVVDARCTAAQVGPLLATEFFERNAELSPDGS